MSGRLRVCLKQAPDLRNPLLKSLDSTFLNLKIVGLTDTPSNLISGKVSIFYRLYSYSLCVISLIISVMYFFFTCQPQYAHFPIFRAFPASQVIVYPVWCLMCSIIRITVSYKSLNAKYIRNFATIATEIMADSYITDHYTPSARISFIGNLVSFLVTVSTLILDLVIYLSFSTSWTEPLQSPWFYVYIAEVIIISSGGTYGANYLFVMSLGVCKSLFDVLNHAVHDCIGPDNTVNGKELRENMQRHSQIWRLVNTFDSVASYIIGVSLTFSVPVFALITTHVIYGLSTPGNSHIIMQTALLTFGFWASSLIGTSAFLVIVAAMTNESAHGSMERLLMVESGPNTDISLLHFIQRLSSTSIGFSYFRLFTVQRTTLLSVFSLMVTYLIVGLQMIQGSQGAGNSTVH